MDTIPIYLRFIIVHNNIFVFSYLNILPLVSEQEEAVIVSQHEDAVDAETESQEWHDLARRRVETHAEQSARAQSGGHGQSDQGNASGAGTGARVAASADSEGRRKRVTAIE